MTHEAVCEVLGVSVDDVAGGDLYYANGWLGIYSSGHNGGRAFRWTFDDESDLPPMTGVWRDLADVADWREQFLDPRRDHWTGRAGAEWPDFD